MRINNEYGHCCYCLCNSCAMLHDLYIEKEYRRKGHAKELVQKAIEEIRAEGYKDDIKIVANPQEDIVVEKLIEFYKKMGLKVISE